MKQIERIIGRKLDAMDIEAIYFNEPIHYEKRNRELISFYVKLYRMPHDLMNKDLDVAKMQAKDLVENFFYYTFTPTENETSEGDE